MVHVPTNLEVSQRRVEQPAVAITSRAPSLWEQAIMLNADSPAASVDVVQPAIDQAVTHLATAPAGNIRAVAASLLRSGHRIDVEQHLLDDLKHRSGAEELAAVRLLGVAGTEASLPTLLELYADEDKRTVAAASIAGILSPAQLTTRIADEADPARQRCLLGVLVTHPDPRALSTYLSFVANAATSDNALDALDDVADPPVDALFAHLDVPRTDRRLAAARALGRINGPAVSERLAKMVERGVHRREALAALMSSSGDEASRFLAGFRRIPSLVSVIRSIELQLRNPF
jgi:HEAT repeat protein